MPETFPVASHCSVKCGRERREMRAAAPMATGIVASATAESSPETEIIMAVTPMMVISELKDCEIVCWRVWETLSTSLVTRESTSPREP